MKYGVSFFELVIMTILIFMYECLANKAIVCSFLHESNGMLIEMQPVRSLFIHQVYRSPLLRSTVSNWRNVIRAVVDGSSEAHILWNRKFE